LSPLLADKKLPLSAFLGKKATKKEADYPSRTACLQNLFTLKEKSATTLTGFTTLDCKNLKT